MFEFRIHKEHSSHAYYLIVYIGSISSEIRRGANALTESYHTVMNSEIIRLL